MPSHSLLFKSKLSTSAEKSFSWHARDGAFERLNPPWEKVKVLSQQGENLKPHTRVTLEVPLPFGLSQTWVHEHTEYTPNQLFTDEQIKGPFPLWRHRHRFNALDTKSCELRDEIEYRLPASPVSDLLLRSFFEKKMARIFRYRHAITTADLDVQSRYNPPPLSILISGGSGFIGSALIPFLTTAGHKVSVLTRNRAKANGRNAFYWDPIGGTVEIQSDSKFDAVIHLAGEGIAERRWSAEQKRRILESRVEGTKTLFLALSKLTTPPQIVLSASAIGIYGSRGENLLTESSDPGAGFLPEVAKKWEAAALQSSSFAKRVALLRTGIVISPDGGALKKMLLPFSLGIGGALGSGQQWMSWIGLNDFVYGVYHALCTDSVSGPVNLVAPMPVTNLEFSKTLAKTLHRPLFFPVPASALKIALGELANEALLGSARVLPTVLEKTGFRFITPTISECLGFSFGR